MASPVQQGSFSSGRSSGSMCSSTGYLYAELQNSAARKTASSNCRVPRTPLTPRALTQTQQRNVVRQWTNLPPIESNWRRAARQVGQAAGRLVRTVEQSLGQVAGLAGTAWKGVRGTGSFIAGLAELQIGLPGAAAQAPNSTPSAELLGINFFADCLLSLKPWIRWTYNVPTISTIEQLLAVCPTVECNGHASGSLQGVTVVIESAAQLSPLAMSLSDQGTTVFISARALDELRSKSLLGPGNCASTWFYDNFTMLASVAPDEWTPASGGSLVLLSSQEFAEELEALRNVSYPACIGDAHACPNGLQPFDAPAPVPTPEPRAVD
jgi:hypothetical protein